MMRTIVGLVLLFLFIPSLCVLSPVAAQADDNILQVSLSEAIDLALKTSEDAQIKENEIDRSNSKLREEKAEFYPHISGLASWSNDYEYPDIAATAVKRTYALDAGVTIDQKLFAFGRISNAVSAARKLMGFSRWDKQATEQDIIYVTKLAYYNVYFAKRTLEIVQESQGYAEENKDILEERSASGRASKYENIKIAADIASRRPSVNNARANLNSAMHALKRIIGVDPEAVIDITDGVKTKCQPLDREKLMQELCKNQPTLKALEKNVAASGDTVREKKAEYFPEISAFSTWNHRGTGNHYDIGSDNLHDYGAVGLKVEVPIWEGGERKEELQQARIDERNAELSLQKAREDLLLELDTAVGEYNEFIKTLEANEEAVRLAKEAFKLSRDMFRSGQLSVN